MRGGEEEDEEDEESGGMAANKTRTPHRDVGNYGELVENKNHGRALFSVTVLEPNVKAAFAKMILYLLSGWSYIHGGMEVCYISQLPPHTVRAALMSTSANASDRGSDNVQ